MSQFWSLIGESYSVGPMLPQTSQSGTMLRLELHNLEGDRLAHTHTSHTTTTQINTKKGPPSVSDCWL